MSTLRLLVVSDIHYAPSDDRPGCRCALGAELLRRAIDDARVRGGFDVIVLGGDLVDDGAAPYAEDYLRRLREVITASAGDVPVLTAFGNHDADADRLYRVFGGGPGLHEIGGYRFAVFADPYAAGDICTRREEDLAAPRQWANQPGGPIVAIQHNPLHPAIESDYPYMFTNGPQVLADYARAGVLLSISGHYHGGQAPTTLDGVTYFSAASLSEPPFAYAMVTLDGRVVNVQHRSLRLDGSIPLVDGHVHTELAYCSSGISAEIAIDRARMLGAAGVVLVEHAPQLYCTPDQFWSGAHIRRPELWRDGKTNRMGDLRRVLDPLRGDFVRAGLEVEIDADERLTLRDGDREWADLLLGAVHFLPSDDGDPARIIGEFMRINEQLVLAGVDVLAHPLRFLQARRCPIDARVRVDLADMLAATRTAAEINFHNLPADVEFLRTCVDRRVKLCAGSDGHAPHQAAALAPHAELLAQLAGEIDPAELLAEKIARATRCAK